MTLPVCETCLARVRGMIGAIAGEEVESDVSRRLDSVDWNFSGVTNAIGGLHRIHWFPGNFLAQIPSYLIEALSRPGDTVADPFCGSGTTGAEAARLGRSSVQADANQLAVEISSAKLHLLSSERCRESLLRVRDKLFWRAPLQSKRAVQVSSPGLLKWFHSETLAELNGVWDLIHSEEFRDSHEVLRVVFSDLLVATSSGSGTTKSGARRRGHWGWIADNVTPKELRYQPAIEGFRRRIFSLSDAMCSEPLVRESFLVARASAEALPWRDESVDCIVTSPPYFAMIDYALANRLSYLWFGLSMESDRSREIGARFKRRRLASSVEYLEQMDACSREFLRVLRPGGYAAIVLGCSRGREDVLLEALKRFSNYLKPTWGPIQRISSRRRVSPASSSGSSEVVAVLRKPR